jgi:phosphate acetyltransferase
LRRRAAARAIRILLPEAEDPRVLSAAVFLAREKIGRPVLTGDPEAVARAAGEAGIGLAGVEVLDHRRHPRRADFARELFERRKGKGLTEEQAARLMEAPLPFAVAALRAGEADGLVAGAVRTTADTVRAGFAGLGMAPGAETVFGAFLTECPHAAGGPRIALFADSAVSPRPSVRALAAIGVAAADLFRRWTGEVPRVAFLSFSTQGSAVDESAEASRRAAELARGRRSDLAAAGELQGDAALVEDIARQKGVSAFDVAGRANVLVFPDLNAGNISYKLVQHLGGARAVGPALAGLSRPMSDLSRGCTDEDIVDAAALTALL